MPVFDRPLVVASAVLYLLVVLAIGAWAARRTHTARDYFIAGQGLGLWVTGIAAMSSAFSGFVFLGGPGLTYRLGVSALWIVLPVGLTSGLVCWVLARKLRSIAGIREIYTVPDAIACRYGCRKAAGLAALAVALGAVAYLGVQLMALGLLLRAIFGWSGLGGAVVVGALALLAYMVAGGMIAGVYTDVAQGGLMFCAAVAVFVRALAVGGGWTAMTRTLASAEAFGPAFLAPLGHLSALAAFATFFVFGVGVLGQPHVLHKFYMIADPRRLRWMPLVLGGSQVVCLLVWVGIGLAVPTLVAQGRLAPLARPDDATPTFLVQHTPDALAGLVLCGVLAAVMSTASSLVNIGSAALVRDLPRALGRPLGRELAWGRRASVAVMALAVALALAYDESIALLGTFAFGAFAAGLAPALAIGLNWERVPARVARWSIATGLVLSPLLEVATRQSSLDWLPRLPLAPGVPPAAVALAASFAVLLVGTWWCKSSGPLDAELREIVDG